MFIGTNHSDIVSRFCTHLLESEKASLQFQNLEVYLSVTLNPMKQLFPESASIDAGNKCINQDMINLGSS